MIRITRISAAAALAVACVASQALAVATSFVEPGAWHVGDPNTTYQKWGSFTGQTGNTPDIGLTVNPAITSVPTVSVVSPGFVAGSGNFYSFSGDYGFTADIYNHGGVAGSGGLPAGLGTHVIVQTSATLNGSEAIYSDTLEIVTLLGNAIPGGANADAIRHDVIIEGPVSSPFGTVTQREEIWEFFLPNYTGDFRVQADVIAHSSFDHIRVDSALGQSAYAPTAIPEPASCALWAAGTVMLLTRRKRHDG
ncbi:MAG: hypothetical protein Kow00105_15760 [Phycisphaeraceae bacterium]